MRKTAATVVFAFLCCAFVAQAAEEPVSGLAGTWILDKDKSDAFPQSRMAGNASGVGDVSRGGGGGRGGMGGMGGGMGGMMGGPGMGGPGMGGARGPGAFTPPPLTIETNGNEVKLITKMQMDGKDVPPLIETLVCDGKQHKEEVPMGKQTIKATLKKDKLVVERVNYSPPTSNGSTQTLTKRTYTLSKDGKTMTLETSVVSVFMSTVQKQVYNRQ